MKKKIISLITLLACTSLVVACNEDTSDAPSNGNNYGDVSNNPGGSTSEGDQNVNKEALDKMIADFVSDTGVTVPSTASYNIEDYAALYYYSYEVYFIYAEVEDPNNAIADAYAATFTADTNLSNLNDEDYPVEDYGYYYADATQNIFINFFSGDNDFVLTIYRYDGLAGTLDVSKVDTSWYVDYANFEGYEVVDTSIVSLIPNYLEIEGEVNIPNPTAPYLAALVPSHTDEDGSFVPTSFSIVLQGDQMLDYATTLEEAGYAVEIVENTGTTIDWDAGELVDYTYYTVSAIDSNQTVYISIQLDENENTAISVFKFDDLFIKEKTDLTDWTEAEKELMNSTLHQVLPFMAFGSDYLLMDASDEDWDYLVLQDSYYEDLSEDYIAILLENGFVVDDHTWEDTYYVYDNGQAYIEIYVGYEGGNYLEIYFEETHLEPLTSFSLDVETLDIVAGASYQLKPIYNPTSAVHPTTWSSSNEDVATVDNKGLVTINSAAAADSTAVITATTLTGKTASCTFTVKANEVMGIAFNEDNYNVIPGGEAYLADYYFLPYGATTTTTISYSINPDNAGITYSADGKLSANESAVVGTTATITVTCGSVSDTATVKVVPATITHTLDRDFFGIAKADYSTYKKYEKNTTDGASYEAYAAGNNGVQLKSKDRCSGIIGRFEGRTCKSITFTFDSNTEVPNKDRKIDIYASNTPFSIADMYGSSVTKVGTITFDKNNLTQTYTFTEEYSYIGFRSVDGAVYLPSIQIVW